MEKEAKKIVFSGRVQGVGFRYIARQTAWRYDLTGWVKNRPDGRVEALLQGPPAMIDACLDELREHFGGYIREMETTPEPLNPRFTDFRITY
jgi:acylphosphatase